MPFTSAYVAAIVTISTIFGVGLPILFPTASLCVFSHRKTKAKPPTPGRKPVTEQQPTPGTGSQTANHESHGLQAIPPNLERGPAIGREATQGKQTAKKESEDRKGISPKAVDSREQPNQEQESIPPGTKPMI